MYEYMSLYGGCIGNSDIMLPQKKELPFFAMQPKINIKFLYLQVILGSYHQKKTQFQNC